MKSRFNYKSRKTIIIIAVIAALLAVSATGVYLFTKGNDRAEAFTETNTTVNGSSTNGETGTTENPVAGEQTVEPNINSSENNENGTETATEVNSNNGATTNAGTTNNSVSNNGTSTSTTNGNVPNQEYTQTTIVTEEEAWYNREMGWEPLELAEVNANTLKIVRPELSSEKIAIVNGDEQRTIAQEGDEIEYVIKVTNSGNVDATNIRIEDTIPEGTTLVENSISNDGNLKDNKITWKVDVTANGEPTEVSFKVTVDKDSEVTVISNTAKVNGKDTETVETNKYKYIVSKELTSILRGNTEVDKTLPAQVGDKLTYTITVENQGNVDIEGLEIEDKLPEGLKATGETTLTFDVKAGETKTATITAEVESVNGQIVNTIVVNNPDGEDPVGPEPKVTTDTIDFEIHKDSVLTKSEENKTHEGYEKLAEVGDTITYTITVKNNGSIALNDLKIEDKENGLFEERTINLEVNGTYSFDVPYTVKAEDFKEDEGTLKIINVVTGTYTDNNNPNNNKTDEDDEKVPVRENYTLTINYVYEDGSKAAETHTETLAYEAEYSVVSPEIEGFTADKTTVAGTMPAADVTETVTYSRANINYTVKYYYQNVLDNTKTENLSAEFESVISTYEDKVIDGYVFDKTEGLPLTISANAEENVINVYYKKDTFEYRVEYYYNGVKDDNATVTNSALFGDVINTYEDKNITGYKFDRDENKPLTISNNPEENVIKVYYVRDTFGYTVEYYYNGVKDDNATVTSSALYNEVISTYEDKNREGYSLEKTENNPLTITEVAANNVMKIYYGTPDISIKSVSVSEAHVGDEITYTITLENNGRVPGTIPVTNTLPDDVTFISATGDVVPVDGVITWDEITVEPGTPVVLTITVKVNDNAIGKTLTDTVAVPDKEPTVHTTKVAELSSTLQEIKQGETGKDSVNIVLVMDLSSSMNKKVKQFTECTHTHEEHWYYGEYCPYGCEEQSNGKWGQYTDTDQTRLDAAKAAAQGFVNGIYSDSNSNATVTVVTFNNKTGNSTYEGTKTLTFTDNNVSKTTATKDNYSKLVSAIGNIDIGTEMSGLGTHIKAALDKTYDVIYGTNGLKTTYKDNSNVVVFLGDGEPTGTNYSGFGDNSENNIKAQAKKIKDAGATIYSIGFGEDATDSSSKAYRVLKNMSSDNTIYTANDYAALSQVFTNIQAQLQDKIAGTNVGNLVFTASNTLVVDENNPVQAKVGDTVLFTCTNINDLGNYNVTYNSTTRQLTWDLNAWNSDPNHTHVTSDNAVLVYYVAR